MYGKYQGTTDRCFVISRALFCDRFQFLVFVFFDLFGLDRSFLVLMGEDKS